jgi:uncharacterized membrane protein YhiD involved in acid resistance
MDIWTILLRLGLTFVLTIIFGLERQRAHKPVGFGTYTFVSMGACALAIAAVDIFPDNPLGLFGAIITAIGFLGAGALIRTGDRIFGFTTSASIWVFSVFGVLMGAGEYATGLLLYMTVWGVVLMDQRLEEHGIGSHHRKFVISTNKIVPHKEIETILMLFTTKHKLITTEVSKTQNKLTFTYIIEGKKESINTGMKRFYDKEWFDSFKLE